MAKSFLTLVAAILVFSLTFSDKIIDFPHAHFRERCLMMASWAAFLLSTASCGVGIYFIFNAGLAASHLSKSTDLYEKRAEVAYQSLNIAGTHFVLGLALLLATATASLKWW